MDLKINKIWEMNDDLQTPVFGRMATKHKYTEIYSNKIVEEGISDEAYMLRAKTFYKIQLPHIPQGMHIVLDDDLVQSGLIYNYNPMTYMLFVYNASMDHIFIIKDAVIGEAIDDG